MDASEGKSKEGKMKVVKAIAILAVAAGLSYGADVPVGNPEYEATKTGMPTTLEILNVGDVVFKEDGTVEIPFTLEGCGATVYLVVYTKDKGQEIGSVVKQLDIPGGLFVKNNVDTLIYVSQGEWFDEGSHTIVWNGKDKEGNPVSPEEEYTYYLIGVNDKDDPTWVGIGNLPFEIVTSVEPPIIYARGEDSDHICRCVYGTDWLTTPEAYQEFTCISPSNVSMGLEVDPNDPDVLYVPVGGWGSGPEGGVAKCRIEGDELVLIEDFGDAGFAFFDVMDEDVYDTVRYWNGLIFVGWDNRYAEPQSSHIIVGDAETGEYKYTIDLPLFVSEGGAYGPTGIDVDDTGIYCVGHGSPYVFKIDHEGNFIWVNGNGDGFNDKQYDDLTYTAGDYAPGVYTYRICAGKYGFAYAVHGGTIFSALVAVYGPDGSGLFFINPEKNELMWPDDATVIDEEGPYDGLYWHCSPFEGEAVWPTDQKILHIPLDVEKGTIKPAKLAVEEVEDVRPTEPSLSDAYPNPFNARTVIEFALTDGAHTRLEVFDSSGRLVRVLVDEELGAGLYRVSWDGRDERGEEVSSGVYCYRIVSGWFSEAKKVVFLK